MDISLYCRKKYRMPKQIRRLKNSNFTIISSTCNGGVIYSDLKQKFNSPTINLFILPEQFIKLCKNLKFYMTCDLVECNINHKYPVGILNQEIYLHFVHYHSFEEAKSKWDERKKRINYDNLYFMMTDRDGCTEEIIKEFDQLPYKNKVIFTSNQYPQYKSTIFCDEYVNEKEVGVLTNFRNIAGERLYDRYFDIVGWLNE